MNSTTITMNVETNKAFFITITSRELQVFHISSVSYRFIAIFFWGGNEYGDES
jgi:hypothetical protein